MYTNTVPSGAFRGYGLSQTIFAIESGIDELATGIGMDPMEFRRRNMGHFQIPLVYVWYDELASGELGPGVEEPPAAVEPEPQPTAAA